MEKVLDIPFGSARGRTLRLDALVPGRADGPRPVVVWLHGGGWYGGDKRNIIDQGSLEFLVEGGFVVVSAEYRLSKEAQFPAQIHDVKAALRWLRARPEVLGADPDRVAISGFSAGAHLSALAAATAGLPEFEGESGSPGFSTEVAAAVAIAPPTDFTRNPAASDPALTAFSAGGMTAEQRLLGGPVGEKPLLARQANPGAFVGPKTPPVLLVHGTDDEVVPVSQADYLFEALQTVGAEATYLRVEGGNHGCWPAGRPYPEKPIPTQIEQRMRSFFVHHLQGKPVFEERGLIEVSALDME